MRILELKQKISPAAIKEKMQATSSVSDYKRWQIIYHVCCYKVDADYLSDITGYSKSSIYNIVDRFNRSTDKDVSMKPKGGRRWAYLSIEEEQQFLQSLETKALQGKILSFKDIKFLLEDKLNKTVSDDYIWDLFKRNGWTKHKPRPYHPNKKSEHQEEFKKNSKTSWMPLKMKAMSH
jgi:transposase